MVNQAPIAVFPMREFPRTDTAARRACHLIFYPRERLLRASTEAFVYDREHYSSSTGDGLILRAVSDVAAAETCGGLSTCTIQEEGITTLFAA